MQVKFRTINHVTKERTWSDTALINADPCCDRMKEHFESNLYRGGTALFGFGNDYENNREVSVMLGEGDYEGGINRSHYFINYCPFCGVKIDCQETEKILRTHESKVVMVNQTINSYTDKKV